MLRLKYFGMIAEAIDKTEEEFNLIENTATLTAELELKYPKLKDLNYKFAVNQSLVSGNVELNANDEIALLPPFAGG
ncbi:MAG: MoaD/ThiS family protein [Vicingaceae bacterium]